MNTYRYDPADPANDGWGANEWLVEHDGDAFHLAQYAGGPHEEQAKQMRCICGGTEFHLGCADYYTAVRCVKCRRELRVHEG